ncbi:MAG: nuclear transport factor 2 family protein [Solirubrobacterales bacterium]
MGANLDHIRSYYAALNTGDATAVAAHFTDDATHYYTRLEPQRGAEAIGQMTEWAVANIGAQWRVENAIEAGDQAAIEWSMTWRHAESGESRLERGTEWFLFRDGKIAEIRAYYHGGPKNHQGNLLGFDHAGRGHQTLPE